MNLGRRFRPRPAVALRLRGSRGLKGERGEVGATQPLTHAGSFISPSGADTRVIWLVTEACTITKITAFRHSGTGAVVNVRKSGALNLMASDLSLTAADTPMDGGTLQNATLVPGDYIEVMLISIAGSPTQVMVQVEYA